MTYFDSICLRLVQTLVQTDGHREPVAYSRSADRSVDLFTTKSGNESNAPPFVVEP